MEYTPPKHPAGLTMPFPAGMQTITGACRPRQPQAKPCSRRHTHPVNHRQDNQGFKGQPQEEPGAVRAQLLPWSDVHDQLQPAEQRWTAG